MITLRSAFLAMALTSLLSGCAETDVPIFSSTIGAGDQTLISPNASTTTTTTTTTDPTTTTTTVGGMTVPCLYINRLVMPDTVDQTRLGIGEYWTRNLIADRDYFFGVENLEGDIFDSEGTLLRSCGRTSEPFTLALFVASCGNAQENDPCNDDWSDEIVWTSVTTPSTGLATGETIFPPASFKRFEALELPNGSYKARVKLLDEAGENDFAATEELVPACWSQVNQNSLCAAVTCPDDNALPLDCRQAITTIAGETSPAKFRLTDAGETPVWILTFTDGTATPPRDPMVYLTDNTIFLDQNRDVDFTSVETHLDFIEALGTQLIDVTESYVSGATVRVTAYRKYLPPGDYYARIQTSPIQLIDESSAEGAIGFLVVQGADDVPFNAPLADEAAVAAANPLPTLLDNLMVFDWNDPDPANMTTVTPLDHDAWPGFVSSSSPFLVPVENDNDNTVTAVESVQFIYNLADDEHVWLRFEIQ